MDDFEKERLILQGRLEEAKRSLFDNGKIKEIRRILELEREMLEREMKKFEIQDNPTVRVTAEED